MSTGLDSSERQALANTQDTPIAFDDDNSLPQDAATDNINFDSLPQHTKGDTVFFEEICETLHPLCVY